MKKFQVSFARVLVGDNIIPYQYSDAEVLAAVSITSYRPLWGSPATEIPLDLRMSALLAFRRFPIGA